MKKVRLLFLFFAVFLIFVQFCQAQEKILVNIERIVAKVEIRPIAAGKSETFGTLEFRQNYPRRPVSIKGTLSRVPPGLHGVHVHTSGDLGIGNDCTNAGGHYNPFEEEHGAPSDEVRHVGDILGNVFADSDGEVHVDTSDSKIDLDGPFSIVGRAVLIHENRDDLGRRGNPESKTSGNAGKPIGCGVIQEVHRKGDSIEIA